MLKSFLLIFVAAAMLSAQKAPSLNEINSKLDKILKILEEADVPAPPLRAAIGIVGAPALGDENATITVVEFTDFQCPYCNKFHTEIFPELHDKFIATGKIRFVSKDLPLPMHKDAMQAAEAGRCAGEQKHFWEMRDWMQSNPTKLGIDELQAHAGELDLDLTQYRQCMALGKYRSAIEVEAKQAQEQHIAGTPAFVIGKSGATVEGEMIMGAQPLAAFERAILAVK